jgi:uncharacterized membrane protein
MTLLMMMMMMVMVMMMMVMVMMMMVMMMMMVQVHQHHDSAIVRHSSHLVNAPVPRERLAHILHPGRCLFPQ